MMSFRQDQHCEECDTRLYQVGDTVPAGTYLRVDDGSFHQLTLSTAGPLPASFDGHVARYRAAAVPCACERQRAEPERAIQPAPTHVRSAMTVPLQPAAI